MGKFYNTGCWLLVVGCWLLDVGCWLLVVGCWPAHSWCPIRARRVTIRPPFHGSGGCGGFEPWSAATDCAIRANIFGAGVIGLKGADVPGGGITRAGSFDRLAASCLQYVLAEALGHRSRPPSVRKLRPGQSSVSPSGTGSS